MYIHLGGDVLLKTDRIVAIIDLEMTKLSHVNQIFLDKVHKDNRKINYISEKGREKTLVVTMTDLYFSPISSITLLKRSFTEVGKDN
ncbi:extracellular matrix regulator RemB [Desulfosporosinus meridiei]|uniref:DUF370 domain-containing protein n=1 Tax=Desulfosporosinus meridiei (strain ATCC BAA-275 / DSM 13257 / KCTC 12902 / NCIMB 13706 / S10) TaxID=768704 RepID=J7IKN0_DESMD|nr:extracellular matrix/biofilm biosynthesis regulator RemA family protein [Desulfosporosinus meridiei]AFQ42115.1 hypothetical protein Desmer_0005 [Desulfosporosinus meridiei DSM 13257]